MRDKQSKVVVEPFLKRGGFRANFDCVQKKVKNMDFLEGDFFPFWIFLS